MTDKEKKIQAVYQKYADKMLENTKNMAVEEEKKYIAENEPKMKREICMIVEKYKTKEKGAE